MAKKRTFEVTISRTEVFTVTAYDTNEAEEIAFEMWDEQDGIYAVEVK